MRDDARAARSTFSACVLAFASTIAPACVWTTSPADAGQDAPTTPDAGQDAALALDGSQPDAGADAPPLDDDAAILDAASDDADLDGGLDATILHLVDADMDAPLGRPDAGDVGPMDSGIARTVEGESHPSASPIAPFSSCSVTTYLDTISGAEHRVPCDELWMPFYPPSSGPHYAQWASFLTYDAPVPWGFLVHAMEHGAVVLAYHCETDADCDAVRAEYAAIVAEQPLDPLCRDEDWRSRIIVVPDPSLPVPIVATAWGHVYEATCLDPASLRAFVTDHYDMATEHLCAPGVDWSATGWCP